MKTRTHSDDFSTMASNTNLVWFFKNVVGLNGDAYTKKMPAWAWSSSEKQKSALLRGLYSGDGSVSKYEVNLSLCSKQLVEETQTMLLSFGVHSRMATVPNKRDKTYALRVSSVEFQKKFLQIGFLNPLKQQKLEKLAKRMPTHDVGDVIPLSNQVKELISQSSPKFNSHDYIARQNNIGRRKLTEIASSCSNNQLSNQLMELCQSDVYFDKVAKVTKLDQTKQFVYDFSVPDCENFICENIIAHNTQEIPVPALKRMGFNIKRMKTRPPLGKQSEAEVSAEDALRTALRLGDSVLIVGEVRSGEAKALYEAMRVGAVGNVVMGTIHGESSYSIWDRVVNDLGVPTTSFKATDMCIVAAPIRFGGSLKRERRVVEVTEVLKHWNVDPGAEKGFLNWLQFDANTDNLEFFEEQLSKSEWIEKIKRTRGMTYEDIFNEINARGETKQYLVDLKNKLGIPKLLEAENTIRAHTRYLIEAEKQREENGSVVHEELLQNWKEWIDSILVKEVMAQKRALNQ